MIPFPFAYIAPETLQEAADAYSNCVSQGLQPMYYGGGTEIITMGRVNSLRFDAVIDLKCIPETKGFKAENNRICIGAAETLNSVSCWNGFPLLTKCCQRVGDHTAQCKITLGGNIAGSVIYHESVLPLLIAHAKAELYGTEGVRSADLADLFSPGLTLKPGEFFVRFSLDQQVASLPFVHAKHVNGEKIGYPLITLAAIRQGEAVEAAVSGLYRYPIQLQVPLQSKNTASQAIVSQFPCLQKEAPLSDISGSGDYRLFLLEKSLLAAMETFAREAS